MGFLIYILDSVFHHFGVDLGGGKVGVSEHFLDGVKVGAVFEKMGGKGMTKGLGGEFAGNLCLLFVGADDFPETLTGHGFAVGIHEKGGLVSLTHEKSAG